MSICCMPRAAKFPKRQDDTKALQLVLEKRRDKVRGYFDELAGKFGRDYVPGRSWKGLAETLLQLMPPMVIARSGRGRRHVFAAARAAGRTRDRGG